MVDKKSKKNKDSQSKKKETAKEVLVNKKNKFRNEFKKQLLAAITAAFAFLIALSWREPISEAMNLLLEPLGESKTIAIKFVGALLITFVAVLAIMFLSRQIKLEE